MSWPLVELGEFSLSRGGAVNPEKYPDEVFDLFSIPAYDTGWPEVVKGSDIGSSKKIVEPGDVLLSKIVPHIRRVWIVGKNRGRRQIASGEWIVYRTKKADPDYLRYFLLADEFRTKFMGTVKGVGGSLLRATPSLVDKIEIPLPPLETQKQIAAILEKADQLRKDCQQMERELNNLAQSVFMDMFGDPVSNPKGWEKASLRSISTKFNDGPFGSNLKTSHYRDSGVQVIRLTNIGTGWFKNDDRAFVSVEHAETLEKFHCKPGGIVIATLGDPNLRACIIPDEVPLAINKADCVHCVPNTKIVRKEYLVEFLNLPSTLRSIENKLHGQTRTRISSGQLAEVDILIPPLSEQDKFMNAIWLRDKELKRLQDQNVAFEDLFNSLMQKAFNGELNIKTKAA